MPRKSAGILLYRFQKNGVEVFLVHPGGPFWANKDEGSWSVPKGEYNDDEDALKAAQREFQEETGLSIQGNFIELGEVRQPSGKRVMVWALENDQKVENIRSNTFQLEWPPKSGKMQEFPEVDLGGWFSLPEARQKILKGQISFLDK
ncbi:MAG: NUDIX domain-containing protein, partial [Calditrichia bacterium]